MVDISKEDFCKIINRLQKSLDKQDEINHVLGAVIETGDLSDTVVELLEKLMNIETDDSYGSDIGYFVWELDFGRNWTPDSITDMNGNSIDFSTAEKLYDYLVNSP